MFQLFGHRKVSQERVLGVSFIDILIQAVFVLLVALMIGYIDPVDRLKIELYEQVGLDLCTKLNKDSPEACREFIEGHEIGLVNGFNGVGNEVCRRVQAKTAKECIDAIDSILANGSQLPCLKTVSQNSVPPSTEWEIKSPDEIIFNRFTINYLNYLKNKEDRSRLDLASRIQDRAPISFKPSEIEGSFSFIRESNCFHEYSAPKTGRYTDNELIVAKSSLWRLRQFNSK